MWFQVICLTALFGQMLGSTSLYSEGETLSEEHQQYEFTVCQTDGSYAIGDTFTFADLNGALNGGNYTGTVISINATW